MNRVSLFAATFIGVCMLAQSHSFGQQKDKGPTVENRSVKNDITTKNDSKKITVFAGKKPVFAYHHQPVSPPDGIDAIYTRGGHIHPLYTPSGKIVTDDFSDDHAHQHGVFNAFVKAKVEGETLDFWNQHRRTANVKAGGIVVQQEPNLLMTKQIHYRLKDDQTIFTESWKIQTSKEKNCFVVDLTIRIRNATDKKITVQKNHYGSFGIRGSGQWREAEKTDFQFSTATGKNRKNGNQSREKWVAMHGKIDGEYCGVTVIGHPSNFRHPQPARLHPSMPYFSFAPMALGAFDIDSEESQTTRLRIVTFDGKLDRKLMDTLADEHGK